MEMVQAVESVEVNRIMDKLKHLQNGPANNRPETREDADEEKAIKFDTDESMRDHLEQEDEE